MVSPRVEGSVPVQGKEPQEEGKKTEGSLKGRTCRVLQSMKERRKDICLAVALTIGVACCHLYAFMILGYCAGILLTSTTFSMLAAGITFFKMDFYDQKPQIKRVGRS